MKFFFLFIKKLMRFLLKPLSFVPALFVMYMIFSLSAQDGTTSGRLSYQISHKIVITAGDLLNKDLSEAQIEQTITKIHYYVRKLGHITEYFILAITVALPLYVYRIRGIWLFLTAGLFCIAFAGLDEYHQSFVAGRGPSARDVAIDSIGILLGILFAQITGFIGRKTIFRPLSSE